MLVLKLHVNDLLISFRSRKPVSQSLSDPMVLVPTTDVSGSPRPDGTLSASHSRQNSPKRLVILLPFTLVNDRKLIV